MTDLATVSTRKQAQAAMDRKWKRELGDSTQLFGNTFVEFGLHQPENIGRAVVVVRQRSAQGFLGANACGYARSDIMLSRLRKNKLESEP